MTVAAEIDALRSETQAGFARIEGQLTAYMQSHAAQHNAEQQVFHKHEMDTAVPLAEFAGPPKMSERVRKLEDAALAQATTFRTLRGLLVVVTGGSVVSALGFAVMVWRLLNP